MLSENIAALLLYCFTLQVNNIPMSTMVIPNFEGKKDY
jgi:hypothetical protein